MLIINDLNKVSQDKIIVFEFWTLQIILYLLWIFVINSIQFNAELLLIINVILLVCVNSSLECKIFPSIYFDNTSVFIINL